MARRVRIGAHGEPDPVGEDGRTREQLVAVDDEFVTVDACPRLKCSEVGAGTGLGVPDRELQFTREDLGKEEVLLFLRAVLHQCRRNGVESDQRDRCARTDRLVVENVQRLGILPASAVLLGPPQAEPAVGAHLPVDLVEDRSTLGLIDQGASIVVVDDAGEVLPQFGAQPP